MLVKPITNNHSQLKNKTLTFKSVRVFKNLYPNNIKMGISIFQDSKKGMLQLTGLDERFEPILGYSKDIETLENMLENLGEKITDESNLPKVRKLLNRICKDFKLQIEGWHKVSENTKVMLTRDSLNSLNKAINNGTAEFEKESQVSNIGKVLCLKE